MNIPFKSALVVGILLGTIFILSVVNDYKTNNDYTSQQVSGVQYPTIVRRECEPLVLGSYNTQTNILTICSGYSAEQEAETLRHELVHFEQDLLDGLGNNTTGLISGESVVQKIWDDNSLYPGLKAHIKQYYQPYQYLIELEAYLLQDYPFGYILEVH